MNRKTVSGIMLTLLFVAMLTLTLHPIYVAPTDGEPLHTQPSLTSHALEWNKTYGGINYDRGYSVAETDDGGYAIAGRTASFGAGFYDFWLVKTDADGNMQWNQTYGGTHEDLACSVVETGDGGYAIAGCTSSFGAGRYDFWLIKLVGPPLPETIDELKAKVEELGYEGEIDNQGIVTSLIAKLNAAQKLVENGKIGQAINMLNAFINEVQAQSGKHITVKAAELLIESAEYILSHL